MDGPTVASAAMQRSCRNRVVDNIRLLIQNFPNLYFSRVAQRLERMAVNH